MEAAQAIAPEDTTASLLPAGAEACAVVLPEAPTLEEIERLERALLSVEAEHGVELRTRHFFGPGTYAREIFIPAGTVLTGARHKCSHLVTFVGDITVWHEGRMVRFTGHNTVLSTPGAKRAGFAHADTYCTGYFENPTNETDVHKLEAMLVDNPETLQGNRKPALPHRAPVAPVLIEE